MSAEEFGGIGFAAGVVRGTRSFAVDKLGRLTGVTYKQVWTPEENQAECRAVNLDELSAVNVRIRWTAALSAGTTGLDPSPTTKAVLDEAAEEVRRREEAEKKARAEAWEQRRADMSTCGHGFYGYYDGSNDYYQRGHVMGVIEGYGETIIGTRGFRCMKARIVALRIPKHVEPRLRALITRNYADIPFFDKFKDMVAAFPPDDAGAGYGPDHPDFWTQP